MIEVGRLCVKIAGRDAGRSCVIVEAVDDSFVIVDGQVKRKRCNIDHLEPLQHRLPIAIGASHEEVVKALEAVGIDVVVEEKRARKPKASGKAKPATAEKAVSKSKKSQKKSAKSNQ